MRRLLLASALAAGLAGTVHAQSATCRDGTVLTGPKATAMCAAHGGLPLGTPGGPTDYATTPRPAQASDPAAMYARPRRAARDPAQPAVGAAPGGGPGQVWVNASSKVYHCLGDRYYGRTKRGEYMNEVAAKAAGAHAAGGRACS